MNNITYLSGWKSELCIPLVNSNDNYLADFNRFLVKGFPTTDQLQQGGHFENANREGAILQIKAQYEKEIEEDASHNTLYAIFGEISRYLRWCDETSNIAFTKKSLEGYMAFLQNRVMLGKLKQSTYMKKHGDMVTTFTRFLDLPRSYFENVTVMHRSDSEPFEAYTRSDLNQLLPFLRKLFNQIYQQFIKNPDKHKQVYQAQPSMSFKWKGKSYEICGAVNKMMCAGAYLLAYYTYANTSDLFKLKRPKNASTSVGEIWYTMPAFKRRAFKTIQVEVGEHELDIPKYAITFFDKLLNASRLIDTDDNATLLIRRTKKNVAPLINTTLQDFLCKWLDKHFAFTDQQGRRLRPMISRFRETGSQLTAYHQGEMVNDIMLNNTPNTRKRHYSKGNKLTNNGMLQDAMSIRQEQIKSGVGIKQAQENLNLKVLVIEAENKVSIPDLCRTPHGGSCANPFGEQSEKYMKNAQKKQLLKKGEKLACADLLKCFGCPNQVIVQSVSDIWCLLSFKACIEESLYLHLDVSHYRKNFEDVVMFIESKILPNIHKKILKQAERKLDNEGAHPLWDDSTYLAGITSKAINTGQ
ncbi:hypothetical protein RRJ81_002645 [Vibrio parahaemolyticus]|nr:hypothetical protein [Vibrio parahaemolyticus]HCE3461888.1 hypothetical protein [Vibrio parahaemolyticus]